MDTKEKHTAQGYQVSPNTALFLDALRGFDAAYGKLYEAIEEYAGTGDVDKTMDEHLLPLFSPLRKEVEGWMLACMNNSMALSTGEVVEI